MNTKPLGIKAYGSIVHLPGSRMGPADHHCHEGQARICTEKPRDKHDLIVVQEKLDGSCVAVAKMNCKIIALGRSGYLAETSPFEQHRMFAAWVGENYNRFDNLLAEGERVCGEWLAQAHGTRYALPHEPFVAFDIFSKGRRIPYQDFCHLTSAQELETPRILRLGPTMTIAEAKKEIETSGHGAIDPVEGAVWRVERKGVVDFLAKWVRPEKVDGCYLSKVSGKPDVWNWRPKVVA